MLNFLYEFVPMVVFCEFLHYYDIVRDVNIEHLVSFERSMQTNTFTNTNKYFK